MTNNTTPREVFSFTFKWWMFLFIAVLVPLDFIYRCGALLASLFPWQLAQNFSALILFFAILALGLAGVSAAFSLLGARRDSHGAEIVSKINVIIGLSFVIIIFFDYVWRWVKITFDIHSIVKSGKLGLLITFLLLIISSIIIIIIYKRLFAKIDKLFSIVRSSYKIIAPLFILCSITSLLIISYNIFSYYRENGANQTSFEGQRIQQPPNIIIITFDALAARYTSLHEYHLQTTPNLDKLGRESYVFDNMYASSNWTLPSLASLLTGKYPSNHKLNEEMSYFGRTSGRQNLPFLLRKMSYETAVVWSNPPYSCPWENNLVGFDQVLPNSTITKLLFESGLGPTPWLNNLISESRFYKIFYAISDLWQYRADQIKTFLRANFSLAKASELITKFRKPFFLWVHLYPPHAPYLANSDFLYTVLPERVFDTKDSYNRPLWYAPEEQPVIDQLFKRYEEYICDTDHEFGRFLTFMKENQVLNNTILIVSSDHGELFERGFWSHGGPYLYEPLIHVPLIIHLPGQTQGKRLGSIASTADLAPTILDLLGVKPPGWMDGQSLKPAWQDGDFDPGVKFSMKLSYLSSSRDPKFLTKSIGAIRGNYELIKYLDLNQYERYDIKNDKILKELSPDEEKIFSLLQKELNRIPSK